MIDTIRTNYDDQDFSVLVPEGSIMPFHDSLWEFRYGSWNLLCDLCNDHDELSKYPPDFQ